MSKRYSIAEARNHLSEVVHEAESEGPITLTRRGRAVAVVVAEAEFRRLRQARQGFWDAASLFRGSVDREGLSVDEVFADVRDRSPGRRVGL